jgi:ABC-type microcin C transport system permease subunit YejE
VAAKMARWALLVVILVFLATPAAPAASKDDDLLAQVLGDAYLPLE